MVFSLRWNFYRELRLVVVLGGSQTRSGLVKLSESLVSYVIIVWFVVVWFCF